MKQPMLTVTVLAAGLFLWGPPGTALPSANADGPAKQADVVPLGQERVPDGEAEMIKELVALQVRIMKESEDPTKRGQHGKHHGCVDADFVVRDDIPKEYRVGLFKAAARFKARVRLSNSGQADDTKKDVRGLAIKVLGVKGPRAVELDGRDDQDFVFIDSETFIAPNAKANLAFLHALAARKKDPDAMKKFGSLHPEMFARFMASLKAPPASPLAIDYWSTVPFKLGDRAVKYTVHPADGNHPTHATPAGLNSLRAAMVEHLTVGKKAAVFELSIIPQTDVSMKLEDPTEPWTSAPVPVATVTITPQEFETPARMKECEEAEFNPWHALAEHRPLGGINRARKEVYPAGVKARREATKP